MDELNGGGSDDDYVYSGDEDDDDDSLDYDKEHTIGDGDDDNTSDAGSELSAASDELEYTATADGLLTLSVNPLKREARQARKAKLAQAKASGSYKDEKGLNSIAEGGSDNDEEAGEGGSGGATSSSSGSKRRSFFSMGLGRRRNRQGSSSGSGDVELNNNEEMGSGGRSGQHLGLLSGRSSKSGRGGGGAVGVEDGLAVGKKKVLLVVLTEYRRDWYKREIEMRSYEARVAKEKPFLPLYMLCIICCSTFFNMPLFPRTHPKLILTPPPGGGHGAWPRAPTAQFQLGLRRASRAPYRG